MDELLSDIGKFLSNTVQVQIFSYPNFSIEILLAAFVCIIHSLLIIEVNNLFHRTNARVACKLRMKNPIREVESSYQNLSHFHHFDDNVVYKPIFLAKQFSRGSHSKNIDWITSSLSSKLLEHNADMQVFSKPSFPCKFNCYIPNQTNNFYDQVENLLSITPSEYIKRDKERKNREMGLKTCLQSFLENTLNKEMSLENLSPGAIQKSINNICENANKLEEMKQPPPPAIPYGLMGNWSSFTIDDFTASSFHMDSNQIKNSFLLAPHFSNDNNLLDSEEEVKSVSINDDNTEEEELRKMYGEEEKHQQTMGRCFEDNFDQFHRIVSAT